MIAHPVPIDRLGPDWPRSSGLTSAQALDARRRYGPNQIVEVVEHPWWALARDTAKDPMIWFFAATSALYGVVGQTGDSSRRQRVRGNRQARRRRGGVSE